MELRYGSLHIAEIRNCFYIIMEDRLRLTLTTFLEDKSRTYLCIYTNLILKTIN